MLETLCQPRKISDQEVVGDKRLVPKKGKSKGESHRSPEKIEGHDENDGPEEYGVASRSGQSR